MKNVVTFKPNGEEYILEIIDQAGEKWIPSQQVGEALGHNQIRNLIYTLREAGELKEGLSWCTLKVHQVGDSQRREILALSYRGVIRVAMRAESERAIAFRDWAEDVLYQVMTTGHYDMSQGDKTRPMLDMAREYERAVRLFGVARTMFVSIKLPFPTAIIKANDWVRKRTGMDCFREFELEYLDAPNGPSSILRFVEENCFIGDRHTSHPPALYRLYEAWAEKQDLQPYARTGFYKEIQAAFPIKRSRPHGNSTVVFRGIGIACDPAILQAVSGPKGGGLYVD